MSVLKNLVENSFNQVVSVIKATDDYGQDLVELFMNAREKGIFGEEVYDNLLNETRLKQLEKAIVKKREESEETES